MKKPIRVSNGVNALKLTSAYRLQCMADADGGLVDSHCAYKTYCDSEGRTICVFAVQDEIFAFTDAEAATGPFWAIHHDGNWRRAEVVELCQRPCGLAAAVALHVAHYDFCRRRNTRRMTPAMAANVIGTLWSLEDLYKRAMA
jgi:hypothetical protein